MRDFQRPGRSAVYATNGMCATSHPLAAQAAIAILQAGGNAVDAAIAGAMVLNIAEPQMCGLGGDCFVLFNPPGEDRVIALNGSGPAPAALNPLELREKGLTAIPTEGILPVTIPGAVAALTRLSSDWGRAGLAASLAPAIRLAREGIPVAPRVAFDWAIDGGRLSGAAREFYLHDGRAPATGTVFRAPGQAEVLERIARDGRDGFYAGPVAEDMVESLRALGGVHTRDDFAAVTSSYDEPVSGMVDGVELLEHPPNGQGATAILMLNILSHFDLGALDPLGAQRVHLEAEAAKLAYDARNRFIADPGHVRRLDHMLSPETAARLAGLIDPDQALTGVVAATEAVHKDTIYITVVDRDRMAVSLIYSIYWGFGSGLASSRYGILFQNRGAGFTLTPGHPNEAGGGKRPMHTIIPAMLRRGGSVAMPFGVMGGAYQPTGHARFVGNLVTYGMDLQQAIDAPRAFAEGDSLTLETGYGPEVAQALAAKGHRVHWAEEPLGGGQAIAIDRAGGILVGASDPRKDGCALGF